MDGSERFTVSSAGNICLHSASLMHSGKQERLQAEVHTGYVRGRTRGIKRLSALLASGPAAASYLTNHGDYFCSLKNRRLVESGSETRF